MMNRFNVEINERIISLIKDNIPNYFFETLQLRNVVFEGKDIVDIGCQTGLLTRKLKIRKANVIGIDSSDEFVKIAKYLSRMKCMNIPYIIADKGKTQLESCSYDIVFILGGWESFKRNEALIEIRRILKKNGFLIITQYELDIKHPIIRITSKLLDKYLKIDESFDNNPEFNINGFPMDWFKGFQTMKYSLIDFYKIENELSIKMDQWIKVVDSLTCFQMIDQERKQEIVQSLLDSFTSIYTVPYKCSVCILRPEQVNE